MKPNQRECPAPGCGRNIPTHLFACRADWYRLPKSIQKKINAAYFDGEGSWSDAAAEAETWYAANPKPGVVAAAPSTQPELPLDALGE